MSSILNTAQTLLAAGLSPKPARTTRSIPPPPPDTISPRLSDKLTHSANINTIHSLNKDSNSSSISNSNSGNVMKGDLLSSSSSKLTMGDVFWPSDGPNFSALPGVGGMYVKGFGLIRGPPSAVGIPIYYFHPLQPPPFESGVYSGQITFIEGAMDRSYGSSMYRSRNGNGNDEDDYGDGNGNGNDGGNSNSRMTSRGSRKPPTDEPSTPWVPLSKREKTPKPAAPPPKASGWQQVLEEMAKKQKGGLKKVDDKEERKVGKLKTGKKKAGEYVDIIDELKHRLARLQGVPDDDNDESNNNNVDDSKKGEGNKKSVSKMTTKSMSETSEVDSKTPPNTTINSTVKEVTFAADTINNSNPSKQNTPRKDDGDNDEVGQNKDKDKNSNYSSSILASVDQKASSTAITFSFKQEYDKSAAAKSIPTHIPFPPPLPTSWPPTPYIPSPAVPMLESIGVTNMNTNMNMNTTIASISTTNSDSSNQQIHPSIHMKLAPLNTDLPYHPSGLPTITTESKPGTYLIPISNIPVGLQTSQRESSIPLPSGYYIPAPRLDMVEPGKYEFGGLTTQKQIDAINRLIRTTIHSHESGSGSAALTPRSTSIMTPRSQSSMSPRGIHPNSGRSDSSHTKESRKEMSKLFHSSSKLSKTNKRDPLSLSWDLQYRQKHLHGSLHPSEYSVNQENRNGSGMNEWGEGQRMILSPSDEDKDENDDDEDDDEDDDDDDEDISELSRDFKRLPRTSIDILQLSRTVDGHIQSHTHHAPPVKVNSNLLLPSGFHSNVQRIRKAQKLREDQIEKEKIFELRRYDDEDLAVEIRRSLPTIQQEKPLTIPKDFVSSVDVRLQSKNSTYRKTSMEKSANLAICNFIDKVYTADTAFNEGYDDIGKAFWTASLRRPGINIDGTYNQDKYTSSGNNSNNNNSNNNNSIDNNNNTGALTRSKSPAFSDVLERRREKTRQKLLQESEEEKIRVYWDKIQKEELRIKALQTAQAAGVYSPMLGPNQQKRGLYIRKMISKYGKPKSKTNLNLTIPSSASSSINRTSNIDHLNNSYSIDSKKMIGDEAWNQISSYPDYSHAMALHELLVRQQELIDFNSYHKNSQNKFMIPNNK